MNLFHGLLYLTVLYTGVFLMYSMKSLFAVTCSYVIA